MQTTNRHRLLQKLDENWGLALVGIAAAVRVTTALAANHFKQKQLPLPDLFAKWQMRFIQSSAAYDPLGLHRGIFLGYTKAIPRPVLDVFRDGGLTHLVAASGFNCWIVGALLMGFSRMIRPRHRPWGALADRGCQVMGAWLFWCWTDHSPPVTRAALMVTAQAFFKTGGLRVPFGRLLLVQYFLSLCFSPELALVASYQLTFGCLFGITTLTKLCAPLSMKLIEFVSQEYKPLVRGALSYVISSVGACLGVSPATWAFFGEINFTSLLTNWVAVPPVTFIIMPLGLIQMVLLAPDWTGFNAVAHGLGAISGMAATWLFAALKFWIGMIPHLRYAPYRL